MNKVFLSGIIADHPVLVERADGNAHLVFSLCVRHRTQKGEVRKELYRINAWKNIARWAGERLGRGKVVALQGYLTQHAVRLGDGALVFRTDVTAEEFFSQTVIESETNGKRPLDKMSPGNRGIRTKADWNWTAAENLESDAEETCEDGTGKIGEDEGKTESDDVTVRSDVSEAWSRQKYGAI